MTTLCDLLAQNAALADRLRELEDEVEYLKAQLQEEDLQIPAGWKLSPSERKVLRCLVRRDAMTRDAAMALLYSGRGGDEPDAKILDVFIFRIRAKLREYGIEIMTVWGQGWYLTEESRNRVRSICAPVSKACTS